MPIATMPTAPLDPQPDHHYAIQEFRKWVEEKSLTGIVDPRDAKGQPFLPYPVLKKHFEVTRRANLTKLLRAVFPNGPPVDPEDVAKYAPKVFSILLLIGKAQYIGSFIKKDLGDKHLPFDIRSPPTDFPTCPSDERFLERFCDEQWRFCPLEMTYRQDFNLDGRRILPIVECEKIGGGGSATVYKIKIHSWYNHLFCSHGDQRRDETETCCNKTNIFALKTYNSDQGSAYYNTEVEAFGLLRKKKNVNIIGFYGGFTQGGRCNVILEYANQGTLVEYFQNNQPPEDGHDIIRFWESLCKIIFPIYVLHTQLYKPSTKGLQKVTGWHQDVKPSNILISSINTETNDEIISPYAWNFMLADLGLSHFKPTEDGNSDQDSQGTITYGAPECHRVDNVTRKNKIFVTPAVDMWSVGAVLSEAAAWVVGGFDGIKNYRNARREAISSIPKLNGTDCFHDGEKVLKIVFTRHKEFKQRCRRSDVITKKMLSMVDDILLENPDERLDALKCWKKSGRIIDDARQRLDNNSRSNTPLLSPSSSHEGHLSGNGIVSHVQQNYLNARLIQSPSLELGRNSMSRSLGPLGTRQQSHSGKAKHFPEPIIKRGRGTTSRSVPSNNYQEPRSPSSASHFSDSEKTDNGGQYSSRSSSSNDCEKGQALSPNPNHKRQSVPSVTSDPLPSKTIKDILDWKEKKKAESRRRINFLLTRDAKRAKLKKSHGILGDKELVNSLQKRDHVFVIDASSSMSPYWTSPPLGVIQVFGALSYFLKEVDSNGLDLYFTGDKQCYHNKHTSNLVDIVRKCEPQGRSDMYETLQQILDDYMEKLQNKKGQPPLSIYILTDGVWQIETDLAPLIENVDSFLHNKYLDGLRVGIQFIQFGNDPAGMERLRMLDDMHKLDPLKFDFVDTTPVDGNIWKMLLGATNRDFDAA